MNHILDQEGLLDGLEILLKNWDCTQLLSYLATNSCAGNELNLKAQAQEYAGNYAQENIRDIRLIPLDDLLKYNLVDGLSTWHVYKKHIPTVIADDQLGVYNNIFKPAVVDVIQMQLTGLPIDMEAVLETKDTIEKESHSLLGFMNKSPIIRSFVDNLLDEYVIKKNLEYKKKVITKLDIAKYKVIFNPNSSTQLQRLLYSEDFLGLPILDYTDSKQPATGANTLEKLLVHTTNIDVVNLLNTLIEYKASAIILSTFLPAMMNAQKGSDGWHYLFGNFRIGGTASGRLSSNNPNLQNLPSGGDNKFKKRLAKLIKKCFKAPSGWLFVGLDFDSLEDKISAVTTKDPNKIKVYSDGYDGHCLRALAYFGKHMPDIETCPENGSAYKAIINGKSVYFHSKETIKYAGQILLGEELYNQLRK
jgi:DNA polymerase-1